MYVNVPLIRKYGYLGMLLINFKIKKENCFKIK